MDDFIGYVRVRVDRAKPLHSAVSVYLDQADLHSAPSGTVGVLRLSGRDFSFLPSGLFMIPFGLPVSECLTHPEAG